MRLCGRRKRSGAEDCFVDTDSTASNKYNDVRVKVTKSRIIAYEVNTTPHHHHNRQHSFWYALHPDQPGQTSRLRRALTTLIVEEDMAQSMFTTSARLATFQREYHVVRQSLAGQDEPIETWTWPHDIPSPDDVRTPRTIYLILQGSRTVLTSFFFSHT